MTFKEPRPLKNNISHTVSTHGLNEAPLKKLTGGVAGPSSKATTTSQTNSKEEN